MAVTAETLRLINGMRIRVDNDTDDVTRQLVLAWSRVWADVVGDWDAAIAHLESMRNEDGKWPSRSQVIRAERAQAALRSTYDALEGLAGLAGVHISTGVGNVVDAAQGHVDMIASQYPPDERTIARGRLLRAAPEQIAAIVGRTQDRVTKTLFPLPGDADNTIRIRLIRGVSQGQNPRVVARRMVVGVRKDFNQALTRAMNIARTEMLDAHRTAAAVVQGNNADVLNGWVWGSALDRRTCPGCFGMHGTEFPNSTPGPEDHQCGRCQRIPLTKSWAELGFPNLDEPASLLPSAQDVFDSFTQAEKLGIMGPTRLGLYDAGKLSLTDLVRTRTNPGWRDSIEVTPVKELV